MRDLFSPIFLGTIFSLLLVDFFNFSPGEVQPFLLVVFALSVLLFFLKLWRSSYILLIFSMSLIVTVMFLREKHTFFEATQFPIPQDQYISISGHLLDFPQVGNGDSVIFMQTDSLEFEKKKLLLKFNIRITVAGNLQYLARGDYLRINAKIYPTRVSQNFFINPLEKYYLYRNIHFNGYCKSSQMVTPLENPNSFWRFIGRWRNRIRHIIEEKYIEPDGNLDRKGVFLEAILLGDRGKITPDQKDDLLSAGIYHLFAISGAHIGVIAIFSLLLLKWNRIPYKIRYIVTGLILVLFLSLSGFKISAQRAVFMALLIFTARILYDDIHIFNIISFSGFILLVLKPTSFLNPGFILTYALTTAIVCGRQVLLKHLRTWPLYIRELFSANISAAIAALPLSLFFFKRYSFSGFLSGLILFPLTALITGMAILLIPMALIWGTLARSLLYLLDLPLRLFFMVVDLFSESLDLNLYCASPSIFLVLFFLIVLVLITQFKVPQIFRVLMSLVLLVAVVWGIFFPPSYRPDNLEVIFLDVGQGDCQCVVFPSGEALLVDGGGTYASDFEVGKNLVLPFLLQQRIEVKWMAVTHYHPDHVKGIIEIINILKPEELWLFSRADQDLYYQKLMKAVDSAVAIRHVSTGFSLKRGTCRVECLFPSEVIESNYSHNNHSGVLKISDLHHTFLLTGDIEWEVEHHLVEECCQALRSDVLKIPHHGSRTSSSVNFLQCVDPGVAIFSFSLGNRFKFPHLDVKKRYRDRNIKTLTTARHGGVRIVSTPLGLIIKTAKE